MSRGPGHNDSRNDPDFFKTPNQLWSVPIPKCHLRCIEFEKTFDMKRERFKICECEVHCPHRFTEEGYKVPAETCGSSLKDMLDYLSHRHLDEIEGDPQD